jgi:hypothetical protein
MPQMIACSEMDNLTHQDAVEIYYGGKLQEVVSVAWCFLVR